LKRWWRQPLEQLDCIRAYLQPFFVFGDIFHTPNLTAEEELNSVHPASTRGLGQPEKPQCQFNEPDSTVFHAQLRFLSTAWQGSSAH
jgi:hypothetical protein